MPTMIPVGPYRTLTTPEGAEFPYYIIPFSKRGECEAPRTRDHLLNALPQYTDVFLFSHGWNNDWSVATARYEHFITGFQQQRQALGLALPAGFRPLLVGVFWPSQALSWFEGEKGPGFASSALEEDASTGAAHDELAEIASTLRPHDRARFYELVQADALPAAEAAELAALLGGLTVPDDEGDRDDAPSADDLLAAAHALTEPEPDLDVIGTVAPAAPSDPRAAGPRGALRALDPRSLLKPFTLWQMKDRAGVVGATGVAELLAGVLGNGSARVHLLGHSFGCKVVMTALCALPEGTRKVCSALLLQPAVSQHAFSTSVPQRGVAGGFSRATSRVERPIVTTFSRHDHALHKLFHVAVRRHTDVGELQFAADGAPSLYAALGGYGPPAADATILEIQDAGVQYTFGPGARVVGIHGTRTISGHGDISNASTWWLSYTAALAPAT